jgi:DNA-binding MarR family transcriptional regulator
MIGGERPPQALGRYSGFLLNWVAARARQRFAASLGEVGLHPREFAALNIVAASPGITQQGIVADTDIDPSTMVATLDSLEERGLAERRPHPEDRRKRAVYLTPAGDHMLARARRLAGRVGDVTLAPLEPAERAEFERLLRKLAGLE